MARAPDIITRDFLGCKSIERKPGPGWIARPFTQGWEIFVLCKWTFFISPYTLWLVAYSEQRKARVAAVGRTINRVQEAVVAKTPAVKKASPKVPDKLTGASVVGYLAEKNGLARKDAKQVMEDIFELVATGVS
jgi:hypothetical protein